MKKMRDLRFEAKIFKLILAFFLFSMATKYSGLKLFLNALILVKTDKNLN